MGEVNVHSQNETLIPTSPKPTPAASSSPICNHNIHHNQVLEPTDLFSMMHLTTPPPCCHRHTPCSAINNPMKRRSPPDSSTGEPCAKKLFCDQEDPTLHAFSAVTIPVNLSPLINKRRASGPVLRRCVSDPYTPPAPANSPPTARGSGLPPLPPKYQRSVSDLSPGLSCSPEKALVPSLEESATLDSVRLRRMKERLKEMRQRWDEVMKDDEEEEKEEKEEEDGGREEENAVIAEEDDKVLAVAQEDDKVLPQDDLGEGDSEEAVSVEWVERFVSLVFKCPCGKGYEVLLSENNCYYKLV